MNRFAPQHGSLRGYAYSEVLKVKTPSHASANSSLMPQRVGIVRETCKVCHPLVRSGQRTGGRTPFAICFVHSVEGPNGRAEIIKIRQQQSFFSPPTSLPTIREHHTGTSGNIANTLVSVQLTPTDADQTSNHGFSRTCPRGQ